MVGRLPVLNIKRGSVAVNQTLNECEEENREEKEKTV